MRQSASRVWVVITASGAVVLLVLLLPALLHASLAQGVVSGINREPLPARAAASGGEVPFGAGSAITTTAGSARKVYTADVDGDGDLDILSASWLDNKIAWYENDGSAWPAFTSHVIATTANGAESVYAADVDGDGDMDALSASWNDNKIAWYENDGAAPPAFTGRNVTTAAVNAVAVCAADVDSDGDVDLLSASYGDDKIAWYENNGNSPPAFTGHDITTSAAGAMAVYAADVDGDGDVDALSASITDDTIAWYENDGALPPGFTSRVITTTADGADSVYAADVDGDGDLDVLSTSRFDDRVTWYENDGASPPAFAAHVITSIADRAASVYAADVDADGDVDVLSASFDDDKLAWYENDGAAPPTFSSHVITTTADGAYAVRAADVDGDGDLDVLSASANDNKITWYPNQTLHRSALYPAQAVVATSADWAFAVHAADVDGDGDTDVLSASMLDDKVAWYENDGALPPAFTSHDITTSADGADAVHAADVDGDGDLDVLAASYYGDKVTWYENDGAAPPAFTGHDIATNADGAGPVYAADVDGDGDMDVLSSSWYDNKIAWYENNGALPPGFTSHTITTFAIGASSVHAADVDGDGDMDVLSASQEDDEITWHENDGASPPAFTDHVITTTANAVSSVYAADVDGDGDMDVLSASWNDDKIAWYENDGASPPAFSDHVITTAADGAGSVYAADLDGDGDLDVLSASANDDKVAWYENDGGSLPAFTPHVVSTSADAARAVYAADVDGDGDLDVLSASYNDDEIAWYENRGGQFALTTTDTAPATILEGQRDDVLQIVAAHRGRSGDTDVELVTFDLLFEESAGDPLTSAEANAVIENLHVYLDDGSGAFEGGQDVLVTTVGNLSLSYGRQSVAFADGDGNVRVVHGTPRTYFVVAELTGDATSQTPHQFRVTHVTESSSTAEDRDHDLPLALEFAPDVASSTCTASASCTPVTDVDLTLVTGNTIYTDTVVAFSADVAPDDAAKPYTYKRTIDGTPGTALASSDDPLVFTHIFATTGTHSVGVALWNCDMTEPEALTDSVEVVVSEYGVCVDLTGVAIHGDTAGMPGVYTFTASYEPAYATLPAFLWDNGDATVASVRVLGVGAHTLALTATNCSAALVTDTHVITIGAPAPGDPYEDDDTCSAASAILTDGTAQTHTFHDAGDADWVRFQAQAGKTYVIQVDNVGADVDAVVALYGACNADVPLDHGDNAFGPTLQLEWDCVEAGEYYLELLQDDPSVYGEDTYDLAVMVDNQPPSAPRSVRASPDHETLIVQWRRSPERDVAGYIVRWGTHSGGPYSGVDEVDGADNTYYEITGLTDGTAYYIVVQARDFSDNHSDYSLEIGDIPLPNPDATQPSVVVNRPGAGPIYTTTVDSLAIRGDCTDDGDNLSRVQVRNANNGAEGWDYSLSGSADVFDVESLPLIIGDNQIQVTAYDAVGNVGSAALTIRRLAGLNGAVVIVGGHDDDYRLQTNIDYVTRRAYNIFRGAGFGAEDIFYLSPTPQDADGDGFSDVISTTTPANVHAALQWAAGRVGPGVPFYLYMMDHGDLEVFCADGCAAGGQITSQELDAWLSELEASSGCDQVNVVVEACHSGSFVDHYQGDVARSISKYGRVVVVSTGRTNLAYASAQGAYFSDAFFSAVTDGDSLLTSFEHAQEAVEVAGNDQTPWLDDNGDGFSNPADGTFAAERHVTSFFGSLLPEITAASVSLSGAEGTITVRVERGDAPLDLVWAAVYAPSFQEPTTTTMDLGVPLLKLEPDQEQEGVYQAIYNGFAEEGAYRVVIYAADEAGNQASPRKAFMVQMQVFLPLVLKD